MIETESFTDEDLGVEVLLVVLEEGDVIQKFDGEKPLLKVRRKINGTV